MNTLTKVVVTRLWHSPKYDFRNHGCRPAIGERSVYRAVNSVAIRLVNVRFGLLADISQVSL
jgi:hypothetical protein